MMYLSPASEKHGSGTISRTAVTPYYCISFVYSITCLFLLVAVCLFIIIRFGRPICNSCISRTFKFREAASRTFLSITWQAAHHRRFLSSFRRFSSTIPRREYFP